jgi:hypothetical protein
MNHASNDLRITQKRQAQTMSRTSSKGGTLSNATFWAIKPEQMIYSRSRSDLFACALLKPSMIGSLLRTESAANLH